MDTTNMWVTFALVIRIFRFLLIPRNSVLLFKKILFIYFQREEKGGRKKGREISVGCLSRASN